MPRAIKIKDLRVGMLWQPFSWKPFELVTSIRDSWADDCVCINDTFHMSKESYTYVEDNDDAQIQHNECSD
jgi:hypothetical protein